MLNEELNSGNFWQFYGKNSGNHPQGRGLLVEFKGPVFGLDFINGNVNFMGFSY